MVVTLAWLGLELITYVWFLKRFGTTAGFAVGLTSFLLGLTALRVMENRFIGRLRTADFYAGRGVAAGSLMGMTGFVLLMIPGFLTDFVGLLLLCGYFLRRTAQPPVVGRAGDTIELSPDKWKRMKE